MGVRHWRTTALLGAAALAASAALAGCSAGSQDRAGTSQAAAPGMADQSRPENFKAAAPAEQRALGGVDQVVPAAGAPEQSVEQRSIVYTGSITVRVPDVSAAAARVTGIATGAGGFVGGDKRTSSKDAADATLELRIPAAKFASVIDQLAHLPGGAEESRGINTEDVTEQTVDVAARIETQQARVDSGRRLLARAKSLSDLVMLESELAKREADLASLTARKNKLADLTALSTITVVLLDPQAVARPDERSGGFLGGLRNGWHALLASLSVLLTVVGALLPWVIAIGLPIWAVSWLVRRFRPRRPLPIRASDGLPAFPASAAADATAGAGAPQQPS